MSKTADTQSRSNRWLAVPPGRVDERTRLLRHWSESKPRLRMQRGHGPVGRTANV